MSEHTFLTDLRVSILSRHILRDSSQRATTWEHNLWG